MKIDLYIDNNLLDTDQSTVAAINLAIASIENPGQSSVSFTKEIKLPMTARNRKVFTFVEQLQGIELFNNAAHICTITNDEIVVMSGKAILKSINLKAKQYIISIIGNEIDWVEGAQKPISELKSDEGVVYTLEKVEENAMLPPDSAPLIRFIPVDRGAFYNEDEDGVFTPRTKLVLKDYHPFLNVWGVLGKIFANYKLNCPIEDKLKRLYFPGSVSEPEDIGYIEDSNSFLAGVEVLKNTSVGDRYYTDIINSVTPGENKDLFDNGVAQFVPMSRTSGSRDHIRYTPKEDVKVKFTLSLYCDFKVQRCYYKSYVYPWPPFTPPATTDKNYYDPIMPNDVSIEVDSYIVKRSIDSSSFKDTTPFPIHKNDDEIVYFPCTRNTFVVIYLKRPELIDRINMYSFMNMFEFDLGTVKVYPNQSLYVFKTPTDYYPNEDRGDAYCFLYTIAGEEIWLHSSQSVNDEYGLFLYGEAADGYVNMPVEITTKNYSLSKGQNYEIHTGLSTIRGSVDIRIGVDTTLAPDFSGMMGEGDTVNLETIGGETPQMDLVQAVKQMCNLMFYTNDQTKELIISPANYFVKDTVVDWRNKIDYSKEIVVQELGEDIGTYLKLNYQEGNDVVQFYNYKTKTTLGQHTINLENKAKTEGTTLTNQLFMPSITRKVDGVVYAPQLVREKEQQTIEETDFNIDRIIVEVVPNTDMTIPAQYRYPIAAFSEYGAKLSFGTLNSYYSKHTQLYNKGKKITAYLRLTPTDVSNIRYFNESMQDFRAKFLLHINGEDIACELQSIQDYNPRDASTKCEFIYGDYVVGGDEEQTR